MSTKSKLLAAALALAKSHKWAVFPVHNKNPLGGSHGFKDATRNRAGIKRLFAEYPNANGVAIRCDSQRGPIVLDVDGPSGHKLLQRMKLPATLMAESRKGKLHLYFDPTKSRAKIERAIRPFKKDGKKYSLDILGDAGYVVAPPSTHPDTGKPYQWKNEGHRIAHFPKSVLSRIRKESSNGQNALPLPDLLEEGERDNMLASLAGSMRRRGASEKGILAALREENETRVVPPLPDKDLKRIAKSIAKKDPAPTNGKRPLGKMHLQRLSNVEAEPVTWLWPNWLPLGQVVVLDGDPGQGKSAFTLDIAARGSRGWKMPDGSRGSVKDPWDTIVLTYEDDAASTVRPRIEAAKGNPKRIRYVTGISTPGSKDKLPPSLPDDIEALDNALERTPNTRLVIIDPLMAAIGSTIDAHRDQDVRRVLSRLAALARKHNVCVLIVRHFKKSAGINSITAGGGSIGIIAQTRIGLIIAPHPDKTDEAVLACSKANLGPKPNSLAFRKEGAEIETLADGWMDTLRLKWTGEVPLTADALMARREAGLPSDDDNEAMEFLREVLSNGRVERKVIMKAAFGQGFSESKVKRAATRMGVFRHRTGFGLEGSAYWSQATDESRRGKKHRQKKKHRPTGHIQVKV